MFSFVHSVLNFSGNARELLLLTVGTQFPLKHSPHRNERPTGSGVVEGERRSQNIFGETAKRCSPNWYQD